MPTKSDIGALILAGGNSSRMGYPKAFSPLGGQTLCGKILSSYLAEGIHNTVLVMNGRFTGPEYQSFRSALETQSQVLINEFPDRGRTYSIQLGLEKITSKEGCFIHNVDNPPVPPELLRAMIAELRPDSYVTPSFHGRSGHPVLVGSKVLQYLRSLQHTEWLLREELKHFKKMAVEAGNTDIHRNLNTPEDLKAYLLPGKQADSVDFSTVVSCQDQTKDDLALCIVVATKGSTPRKAGAKMLVAASGTTYGSIGGGNLEKQVVANALEVLNDHIPRVFRHELLQQHQMCCGGTVEVYIEPIMKKSKLYVFGAGHVGQAIANHAATLDFDITVVDDRPEYLEKVGNNGVKTMPGAFGETLEKLSFDADTYVVIVSYDHDTDRNILAYCLGKPHAYLGMIGSRRKILVTKKRFRDAGIATAEVLDSIDMPIGLDIGAETPGEIAIAIVAKLIKTKRSKKAV